MNYKLSESPIKKTSLLSTARDVGKYIGGYGKNLGLLILLAFFFVIINSIINVYGPSLIGDATKEFIASGDKSGLAKVGLGLLLLYIGGSIASYFQILIMGRVGQNILSRLRFAIFNKLQSLPLQFFNENKSGDLISRINTDTDKLNQALSETLLRFVGNIFIIIGVGIAILVLNPLLGSLALLVALFLFLISSTIGGILTRVNRDSLKATGDLSAEVQESLSNFKVVVAYNRRDYFRETFNHVNETSKNANVKSSIMNNILTPIYDFGGNFALFIIYFVGINLILYSSMTILGLKVESALEFGTLISYVLYIDRFYSPLRIMASLYSSIQTSLAAWGRISDLLSLETDLNVIPTTEERLGNKSLMMQLQNVSFGYEKDRMILNKVNINIEKGKTYALVGPTGGGKSTTASLMARLFDVVEGRVLLKGRDIRTYSTQELSNTIGFILQEPFLFSSSLRENILYGNAELANLNNQELEILLKGKGLDQLLERFPEGLETSFANGNDGISLGQKQLVAFLRVILREPEILILDEATANIDTITEHLLQEIISKLPEETTKIVIAHRLNTIEKADQIFFIANGEVSKPIQLHEALEMIENTKKSS